MSYSQFDFVNNCQFSIYSKKEGVKSCLTIPDDSPNFDANFMVSADTTVNELIDVFGEPTDNSYKDILSATGYLKYGTSLYCTRALPVSATFAGCYDSMAADMSFTGYTTANAYILNDLVSEDPDEPPLIWLNFFC